MNQDEPLSVIVLTKDEASNLPECLDAVLAQLRPGDEVLVVDSASADETVAVAKSYAQRTPCVRVHASAEDITFGAARNLGVRLARHDVLVFLSADAVPEPEWLSRLRAALQNADIVYGRQRHAPTRVNIATVSRGLRYHHYEVKRENLPEAYASNVNAAYRRLAFDTHMFDEVASGSEDLAFARRARLAGLRIAYAPDAVVGHKDVATIKGEWRKNEREGRAHAQLREILGAPRSHLAWATAVAGLSLIAVVSHSPWILGLTLLTFFAPTLRRLVSPAARRYRPLPLLGGALSSPFFDLAFVSGYLRTRIHP